MNNSTIENIQEEIHIDASIERVFQALADPIARTKWWGIEGKFQAVDMESDLRTGGGWSMTVSAHGKQMKIAGEYVEVDPPQTLAMTWLPEWQESRTPSTVRFELSEEGSGTHVRLTHSGFTAQTDRENYRGWKTLLGLLANHVTGG